jgi:uncharacterized protein
MKSICVAMIVLAVAPLGMDAADSEATDGAKPRITVLDPPESGFFSKQLMFKGIPIKAHKVVSDETLYAAVDRLAMMLRNQQVVASNLAAAGVELHIIGKDQVTTDLPEWRDDKGKPLAEYNGLTRDQRTRGMGGLLTSCGEENLLRLENDRYRGRDICVHEFAHAVFGIGMDHGTRSKFVQQYRRSLGKKLWNRSYAATNPDEFFAELSMWYFGTHGDLGMVGPKPTNGPDGLKSYDPEAFKLMDAFYCGRLAVGKGAAAVAVGNDKDVNLALVAVPSASYISGDTSAAALNDGNMPMNSLERGTGSYGNWPRTGTQWVQCEWSQPICTKRIEVYWWDDHQGVRLPNVCRLLYWDGKHFRPVVHASGLGVAVDQFNVTTFDEVKTTKLRLEIDGSGGFSTGLLEWRVLDSGKSPAFPPTVVAGADRVVLLGGKTHLSGSVKTLKPVGKNETIWSQVSGPGKVTFADPRSAVTTAIFSEPGEYQLQLTAGKGTLAASSTLSVRVENPPPAKRLDVVYTKRYRIDSPLWGTRVKALIVNWIPHCIDMINRSDLKEGQGGIDNFVEAGKALRGEPHAWHKGYVFSDAWVHQTVEAICLALMVDPQGDAEIIKAQRSMRATLEDWIPKILAAQQSDGYLHTAYTLTPRIHWPKRWSPAFRGNHEGYVAGYFIESAINHYMLTEGKDKRLYNAAKRLANCWVANIGPGRREWYDGHQEMEMALARFGRFVNDMEGRGRGDAYIKLARHLLDARRGGEEYDQSHLLAIKQYEAVGHAVRAVYFYSAMADIAAETRDLDYGSAVMSLWDNLVNKKYYVTGGVGSGETAEGFGPNFSLPNDAYCESCSSCGLIFFQHKLNLAYHDAKYADLYEETLYNALLGSMDLDGRNFQYTNPLEGGWRGPWHVCPCCVGNIPRTLLMLPTWTYAKGDDGLYVNLFIGGTTKIENLAGTDVEVVQKTDYPWSGRVAITVNPKAAARFSVHVREPNRATSRLYTATPEVSGVESLAVNGQSVPVKIEKGYAIVERQWQKGDTLTFKVPMKVQRIKADKRIEADRGLVALRYGPLVNNVETADQPDINQALSAAPLSSQWRGDLLGGVTCIKGTWADGKPMLAIPHYARLNRGKPRQTGQPQHPSASKVWMKDKGKRTDR